MEGDVLAVIAKGNATTMVDTGGSRFIDIKYKGQFVFRDSYKQLAKSLDSLGKEYRMPTLKGTFPHAALRRPDAVYADKEVECKPPRTNFVVSVDAPLKHKRRALLSEAEYAK